MDAPGPHDFTVRKMCRTSLGTSASTAFRSTFVTTRAPLFSARNATSSPQSRGDDFCAQIWFYGTGGLVYGGVKTSVTNIFTPGTSGTFAGTSSDTRIGWAAGAGIEWSFAPNWSVKGEYLHIDLGSSNTTILDPVNFPGAFATCRFQHELETVRVGINYRFSGPIVARY